MELLFQDIDLIRKFFSISFLIQTLLYFFLSFLIYSFVIQTVNFVDERILKKGISDSGFYTFLKLFYPILVLWFYVHFYLLKSRVVLFFVFLTFLVLLSKVFLKPLASLLKLSLLTLSGHYKVGTLVDIKGSRCELVSIGLFNSELISKNDGSSVIIPTLDLVDQVNFFPKSELISAVNVVYGPVEDVTKEEVNTIKRVLLTKPYINKKGFLNVKQIGRDLHLSFQVTEKELENHAKLDVTQSCKIILS